MDIPWQKITKFGQQTMLDSNLFAVSWILGRFCNYKCSYCWPYARSDVLDYQPYKVYTSAIDSIKKQARQNGFSKFHWSFSGGEPTAYRQLIDLINYLNDREQSSYQSIHMTTNLSPGKKWWHHWIIATKHLQRRSITASYHDEFANESDFGDKCLLLMDQGVFVTVNQVMIPDKFAELYERLQRLADRGINVTCKPQSNETASKIVSGYTEDMIKIMQQGFPQKVHGDNLYQIKLSDGQQDYFLDQAERFNSFGFNQFTNWTCNSGYQSVIIRGNEVKRGYSCWDDSLGTLEDFSLFTTPQLCKTPSCVSSADSKIPKCK